MRGREIFMRGLYVFSFWCETLAERFGATLGATIGVGTWCDRPPLQVSDNQGWCKRCHQLSPFRLERAHAREGRALRAKQDIV